MAKRKQNPQAISVDLIRWGLVAVITVVVVFLAGRAFSSFLHSSKMFLVREIFVEKDLGEVKLPELEKLKGRNIFLVDLAKVEDKVRSKYPHIGDLKVLRHFPDGITISGFHRQPVAVAVLNGQVLDISADGYLLRHAEREGDPLTVVRGLKAGHAVPGAALEDPRLELAVNIIGIVKGVRVLSALGFHELDVTDPLKIICRFKDEAVAFDVYMERDQIAEKVEVLSAIVERSDLELAQVRYIDLRLAEPLIGRKKVKK